MKLLTQLELYELPIESQVFADAPDPHMLAARRQHPFLARCEFGFVVTDYDACDSILRLDQNLKTPAQHIVQIMGGEGTNWARFQVQCLIAREGGDHTRIRNAVRHAFSPRAVADYSGRIEDVITSLIAQWGPLKAMDFEDFASRFPVAVMFGLMGVPREKINSVKELLETVGQSFSLDQSLFPRINECFDALWEFVGEVVEASKAEGTGSTDDLLGALIRAESNGDISNAELRDLVLFLFVAGYDTSKNQLSHIMNLMLGRADLWRRCADDREFCSRVVDEALRHSGVATSYRNVVSDFTYRGVAFEAGTMLIFPMGIVCRYSGPFHNGREFDPDRSEAIRHTAFSRGEHMCLGQYLAKSLIVRGLHLIAQHMINPRRDGQVQWRLFPGVWGPKSLPVAFDYRP